MKLYVHTENEVIAVTVGEQEKVGYLRALVAGLMSKGEVELGAFAAGRALSDGVVVGGMFDDKGDVYVLRSEERKELPTAPQPSTADTSLIFITLTKYSFYEADEEWVKVVVPLEGVKTHPKEEIETEFRDKSFQIKVKNLRGKHYIFGVPRLQCHIIPSSCKYLRSTDKLVVSLKKVKSSDNWHSLFKAKTVGGDDSD